MSTTASPEQLASLRLPRRAFLATHAWLSSTRVRISLVSVLVLVPCFWQSHIQAGDLSSHLYNAWLSILIGAGKAPGLVIVPQWTNVLFDWMLSGLMRVVGAWGAEHIAVPFLVLNFFWGAFVLVCTISRRRPWYTLTFLAMLAHGWVFHMGFMNFYLAMGLSFWALALLWRETWKGALGAAPLLALAYLAHALPVAWVAGIMIYTWIARRIRPQNRLLLTSAAVVSLAAIGGFLMARFPYRWIVGQILTTTGADQVSVFGAKYYPIACLTLALWIALLARLRDARVNFFDVRLQACLITSAATLLLPSQVLLPQAHHALGFINDRISLFVAILACALLGQVEAQKWQKAAGAGLAVLFFSFLYVDTRALNRIEDAAGARISQLPANARVISGLCDPQTVINPLAHIIDRPCIGHCYSYANYEPSTKWFRVRALPQNSIVTPSYADSDAMQNGRYVVHAADTPLFEIYFFNGHLETRLLEAGSVAQNTNLAAIPTLKQLLRGGGDRIR